MKKLFEDNRSRRTALHGLAVVLAMGWGAAASAQQDDMPPLVDVVEVVEVVLVNVEVWVQDSRGNPIHGLTASDFEVFEDGRPVEITHFAEIRSDVGSRPSDPVVLSPAAAPEAASPEPEVRASQPADPPHLVVYFDQLHLSPSSARRVARDLERFIAEGQVAADRVAILRQDFDLELKVGFGSTLDQLAAAIEGIADSSNLAGGEVAARQALQRMQLNWEYARSLPNPCQIMANLTKAEVRSRSAELRHHFDVSLGNLNATARFLAGLPGLKTLVLVSDSLEIRPAEDLLLFARNVCPGETELNELELLGEATDQVKALQDFALSANANRVTFYPLQASGLAYSTTFGAENRALDSRASRGVDTTLRRVQQTGLLSLAEETGGVATLNSNRFLQPLESIARDMGTYYSLAYAPPTAGDGKNHSIEVKVGARNATVRHRLGYRDKSATEKRDERLEGAIAFGVMDNPSGMRLAVGTLEVDEDDRFRMPLHVLVPSAGLAFLPGRDQAAARVEIVARAREAASGQLVEQTETLTAIRATDGSATAAFTVDLSLAPGVWVLAVALRDLSTGETSVVSTTVAVQDSE